MNLLRSLNYKSESARAWKPNGELHSDECQSCANAKTRKWTGSMELWALLSRYERPV